MPTYVYETIPAKAGAAPVRFEVEQRMSEPALSRHPDTGEPVRRVISGGLGFIGASDKAASAPAPEMGACGQPMGSCGMGGCGHTHH